MDRRKAVEEIWQLGKVVSHLLGSSERCDMVYTVAELMYFFFIFSMYGFFSFRGKKIKKLHKNSEVLIDQCIYCYRLLRLQSHGILSDGSAYLSPNLVYDSELIGLPLDNDQLEIINCTKEKIHNYLDISSSSNETDCNWWVKTKLDDNHYLVSASRGFHVWNAIARKWKEKKE